MSGGGGKVGEKRVYLGRLRIVTCDYFFDDGIFLSFFFFSFPFFFFTGTEFILFNDKTIEFFLEFVTIYIVGD